MVKCLKAALVGSISDLIQDNIDKDLPYPFAWLTWYIYWVAGIVLTFAVQSRYFFIKVYEEKQGLDWPFYGNRVS